MDSSSASSITQEVYSEAETKERSLQEWSSAFLRRQMQGAAPASYPWRQYAERLLPVLSKLHGILIP